MITLSFRFHAFNLHRKLGTVWKCFLILNWGIVLIWRECGRFARIWLVRTRNQTYWTRIGVGGASRHCPSPRSLARSRRQFARWQVDTFSFCSVLYSHKLTLHVYCYSCCAWIIPQYNRRWIWTPCNELVPACCYKTEKAKLSLVLFGHSI